MSRGRFQRIMFSFMLIYMGLILTIIPYFIYGRFEYREFVLEIVSELGKLCFFVGILMYFYSGLSRKIDTNNDTISAMKAVGIERIIPADSNSYAYLEDIMCRSSNVKIVINVFRLTDKFYYLLDSLLENDGIKFEIIVAGKSKEPKICFLVKELYKKKKENVNIKTIEKSQIGNLLIFDEKSCILHYSDFDNKLSHITFFYNTSENGQKNRKLFRNLWNEGKAASDSGEGV